MRKSYKLTALAAGAALALSACGAEAEGGGDGADVSLPDDKDMAASISYGLWDDVQRPAMEELIAGFNEEYPNIDVSITTTPFAQYFTKLQTQAGGGELPDVFWLNGPNFQTYAAEGMIEPLSSLVEAGAIDPANYPDAMNDLYSYEGTMYAVPKDYDTVALWYNEELFERAGVDVPTGNWTWEDFTSAAKTISTELEDEGVYGYAGGTSNQSLVYDAVLQAGGEIITEDGKSGYDSPEALKAFEMLAGMVADGSSPSIETTAETQPTALFSSGQAAMIWDHNQRSNVFAESPDFESFNVVPLPKDERQATVIHGVGNAMAAEGENKEAAAAFLTYLGGEEAATLQAESGAANPAYVGTQDAYVNSIPEIDLQIFIDAADEYAFPYPVSRNSSAWLTEESTYFPRILSGELPVEEGLSQLAEAVNEHLANEK
ncbi:sugar ABC transporter substrate-binding protein [Arthrobacter flavus]|uniref:ABC transporter substrate-binding protein n=1 Tax=Arthrobacter flavus TaxID=95172 RepID=A0ABW4QAT5_9MICC